MIPVLGIDSYGHFPEQTVKWKAPDGLGFT